MSIFFIAVLKFCLLKELLYQRLPDLDVEIIIDENFNIERMTNNLLSTISVFGWKIYFLK